MRKGKRYPVEVRDAALRAIEQVNPQLNALVH